MGILRDLAMNQWIMERMLLGLLRRLLGYWRMILIGLVLYWLALSVLQCEFGVQLGTL